MPTWTLAGGCTGREREAIGGEKGAEEAGLRLKKTLFPWGGMQNVVITGSIYREDLEA